MQIWGVCFGVVHTSEKSVQKTICTGAVMNLVGGMGVQKMPILVVEICSSNLKDFAHIYGLGADIVQKMHDIAHLENWGYSAVTAETLMQLADVAFHALDFDELKNLYEQTDYETDEQGVFYLAKDILRICCDARLKQF